MVHSVPFVERNFTWILASGATALVLGALFHAVRVAGTENAILGSLEVPLAIGGAAVERVSSVTHAVVRVVRLPMLLLLVLTALSLRRREGAALDVELLAIALGLAGVAQSYLLDWQGWKGLGVYVVALGVYLARPRSQPAAPATLSVRLELGALLAMLGLFLIAGLYRLDLYPPVAFDEVAYLAAARQELGEATDAMQMPRVYPFEHFHAQIIPLLIDAGAVALLPSGLLPLRLVSVTLGAVGLLCAALALRGRLGPLPTLLALTLTGISPLLLTHARLSGYFSVTFLHGVLCFWALLRFCERRDRMSAMVLGGLVGSSLYLYQLSWFIPVFCTAVLALRPEIRRHGPARRALLSALAVGLVVVAPALGMRHDLAAVSDRTFDGRAIWAGGLDRKAPEIGLTIVMTRTALSSESMDALVARLETAGVSVVRTREPLRPDRVRVLTDATGRDHTIVRIGGFPAGVARVVDELRREGARTLFTSLEHRSPIGRLQEMLSQLLLGPHIDESAAFLDGPVLHPLLAPLVFLGLAAALRRRQEPLMTALLVWVVGGALLPAVIGGPYPRRTLLMLPFCYALAALTLIEVMTLLMKGRAFVLPVSFALVAYLALAGSQLYHHGRFGPVRDDARHPGPAATIPLLELAKTVKALPREERMLIPGSHRWALRFLRGVERETRVDVRPDATSVARVREISCAQALPFAWIALDDPEQNALLSGLQKEFSIETRARHGYRVHLIAARRPDACRDIE